MNPLKVAIDQTAFQRTDCRPDYPEDSIQWLFEGAGINQNRSVLHIYSSAGKFLSHLNADRNEVFVIEPGERMRSRIASEHPSFRVIDATAEHIPLTDGCIDIVTVGNSLHWFQIDKALAEIHRVLRPSGKLAILYNRRCPTDPFQKEISKIANSVDKSYNWQEANWRGKLADSMLFCPGNQFTKRFIFECDEERAVNHMLSIGFIASSSPIIQNDVENKCRELVKLRGGQISLMYDCVTIITTRENGTSLADDYPSGIVN